MTTPPAALPESSTGTLLSLTQRPCVPSPPPVAPLSRAPLISPTFHARDFSANNPPMTSPSPMWSRSSMSIPSCAPGCFPGVATAGPERSSWIYPKMWWPRCARPSSRTWIFPRGGRDFAGGVHFSGAPRQCRSSPHLRPCVPTWRTLRLPCAFRIPLISASALSGHNGGIGAGNGSLKPTCAGRLASGFRVP